MNMRVLKLIQVYASHSPSILEENTDLEVQILCETKTPPS